MLRILRFIVLPSFLIFVSASCQPAGSGASVIIPPLNLVCQAGNCASFSGSRSYNVFITEAGCSSPEFSAIYSAAGSVACSSGSCRATVSEWVNRSGTRTAEIPASTYDFCAVVYFNGGSVSGITSGDVEGALENIPIDETSYTSAQTMNTWTAVP